MLNQYISHIFHLDSLAVIVIGLVAFIGLCVGNFARRYMKGDARYRSFFAELALLIFSVAVMASADHLALFFAAWCSGNILLVRMMVHKSAWQAARASGRLAAWHFVLGASCLAGAFSLLHIATGQSSIHALLQQDIDSRILIASLSLLLVAAMTQSAIWPFHTWLTSSLNSPTPVSALMHAGLVNGGGFLLARFAPLYFKQPEILPVIFAIGIITALLGTLWKLMQHDVKRMLACSTVGQMGFMFVQCGAGLIPSAVAHLFLHGLFKAYLFLASGSAATEKRAATHYPPKASEMACALLCGAAGSLMFTLATGHTWTSGDTTVILLVITLLTGTQLSLPMLRQAPLRNLPVTLILIAAAGLAYGGIVGWATTALASLDLLHPQPLDALHITGILALVIAWLSILFMPADKGENEMSSILLKAYVTALNASQPHAATVTAHRNHYKYM